jgi:hypothetical protein
MIVDLVVRPRVLLIQYDIKFFTEILGTGLCQVTVLFASFRFYRIVAR